jgi:hypothetical protein
MSERNNSRPVHPAQELAVESNAAYTERRAEREAPSPCTPTSK